jgi:hypothetical protein
LRGFRERTLARLTGNGRRRNACPEDAGASSGGGRGLRLRWGDEREILGDAQAGERDEPGDGSGVEARGIEFDAQGVRRAVEGEGADAVDVAGAGQREGHLLRGRDGVAKENLDRGHRDRIAAAPIGQPALERLEKGADGGAGPVLRADVFAADDAVAVDDVGLRPHVGVEEFGSGLAGVADGDEVDMTPGDEGGIGVRVIVNADADDDQAGHIAVKLKERRQLLDAGGALTPPEVEQDHAAAIAGQMDGGGAVRDGEVGSGDIELCGPHAAVAGRRKREGEEKREGESRGEPHLLIIRSERAERNGAER